jgi:hypothetical protein
MAEIFGEFIEEFPPELDSLELTFTPSSHPIKQRWRNNRLSAHFVADYFCTFLPVEESDNQSKQRIKESKCAVSYVANELLENAMKFNDEKTNYRVKFGIHFIKENTEVKVVLFATNSINPKGVDKFQSFIEKLLDSDVSDLYIQQIEKSVQPDNTGVSGLGLLTMIHDYSAKLGWRFDTVQDNPQIMTITTMAQIVV